MAKPTLRPGFSKSGLIRAELALASLRAAEYANLPPVLWSCCTSNSNPRMPASSYRPRQRACTAVFLRLQEYTALAKPYNMDMKEAMHGANFLSSHRALASRGLTSCEDEIPAWQQRLHQWHRLTSIELVDYAEV